MAKRRKPAKPNPSRRKTPIQKKRSLAASKGWETRRAKARSLAAAKGWETRRAREAPRPIIPIIVAVPSRAAIEAQRRAEERAREEKRRADAEAREAVRKWFEEQDRLLDIDAIKKILVGMGARTRSRAERMARAMTDAERAVFLETLGYDEESETLRDPDAAFAKLQALAKDLKYNRIVDGNDFSPFWYHQVFDPR